MTNAQSHKYFSATIKHLNLARPLSHQHSHTKAGGCAHAHAHAVDSVCAPLPTPAVSHEGRWMCPRPCSRCGQRLCALAHARGLARRQVDVPTPMLTLWTASVRPCPKP